MKKIMFSERYGLQQAVIAKRKTMTRRIINGDYVKGTMSLISSCVNDTLWANHRENSQKTMAYRIQIS